jgi:hypothetical protein
VDDILVTGPSLTIIRKILEEAAEKTQLKLKEIGLPTTFLGLEVEIQQASISLSLRDYTKKAIQLFDPDNNIPLYDTPFEVGVKLVKSSTQATKDEIKYFEQQTGALLYLTIKTRPDIT